MNDRNPLSRWSWLMPAIISLAGGAIAAWASLQTLHSEVDVVELDLREHRAMPAHAGVLERLNGMEQRITSVEARLERLADAFHRDLRPPLPQSLEPKKDNTLAEKK